MTVDQYTTILRLLCFIIFSLLIFWISLGIEVFYFKDHLNKIETKVGENTSILNAWGLYENTPQ